MSQNHPSRRDLRPGMTVRVVQEQENNDSDPLIGEVKEVVDERDSHPQGVEVKLESGVTGRAKEIVTDAREDELTE